MNAIKESIDFCKKNKIKIALTFSDLSMVKYFKNNFNSILKNKINLLFCNEEEALTFSNKSNLKDSYEFLLNFSEMVVITRGSKGSLIVNNFGNTIEIKPYRVKPLDTVGAGDTFAGGFLYGINNGMNLEQSGNLASALSSKVVTKLGPRLQSEDIKIIKQSLI